MTSREIISHELKVAIRHSFGQPTSAATGDPFSLHLDFSASPGFTILFGPSGAGKTTLLDCISGLTIPAEGSIVVAERVLFDSKTRTNLPPRQRRIGYVFQESSLFPHMTVEENVEYGLFDLPRSARRERASAVLAVFGVDSLRMRKPSQISGGQRQRVALARALVTEPSVLLLDEPLAALDSATKSKILDDLRAWNQTHHVPILYVTHSREEAFALGERMLVLEAGRIVAQGAPHDVLRAPLQESVAQLAGFENVFDATVESQHPERGTMTCRIGSSPVLLETPLVRSHVGEMLRVGVRAGDILLAVMPPTGLSARNIFPGRMQSLEQRDVMVRAMVDCGAMFEVHLTLAARDDLKLALGSGVWLVIKTYSCHVMRAAAQT
jgi:molybdate transport system ATP-binding protein